MAKANFCSASSDCALSDRSAAWAWTISPDRTPTVLANVALAVRAAFSWASDGFGGFGAASTGLAAHSTEAAIAVPHSRTRKLRRGAAVLARRGNHCG